MDISVGSTRVPGYSDNLSESVQRAGNREASKCSEEQNQTRPQAAPTPSAVRFKIRSAKERQQVPSKVGRLGFETFENASRGMKECREEMSRVHTLSPPSPDTGVIDARRPRALNPFSLSSTTPRKLDCLDSPTTRVRGRTELRQAYLSNRSKSLDWRGPNSEGGIENQTDVIRNTQDLEKRSIRRSESLERNNAGNRPNPNELARPLKRVTLQIQPFNGNAQGKQDRNGLFTSSVSVTSPVRVVALAQSFPSGLKGNQSQERPGERKIPWHSEHSSAKPVQTECHLRSHVTISKVNENTGNHNVKDSSEASSGITSYPFLNSNKWKNSVLEDQPSFSSPGKVKTVSYNPEQCGTFPKTQLKKEQRNFTTLPDATVVLPSGNDNLETMSARSKEDRLNHDSVALATNNSTCNQRRLTPNFKGQGTQSLGRTRNRYFTTPIVYSTYDLNNSNSLQKSTRNDIEGQAETTTKGLEAIPGQQPHSLPEGVITWPKSQSSQSMTSDSEKHHRRVGLEFGSSGNTNKKSEASFEKLQESPLASVRNTIHKFEALALQNQSSSRIQCPRRTMSVTENPKTVASVQKTYSDRSFGMRWRDKNRSLIREQLFSKSEVSDEAVSFSDQSGPAPITMQEESTVKLQSEGIRSNVPEAVQTLKQDERPSGHKKEAKFTMMSQHVAEPDFSKGSSSGKPHQNLKNIGLTEEKSRNYLSPTVSHNSQKTSGFTNVSHSDRQDFSYKTESKVSKPANDKSFLTPHSAPVFPNAGSSKPTQFKPTHSGDNRAHLKSPPNLFGDLGVIPSIQAFPSASGDHGFPFNTMKDEKVAAKVIRWIMHKGVDDEIDEDYDEEEDEDDEGTERGYDSDSGESSITITSNVSNRSFSMSLVELCSLGGSKDDENWMSKRTVSMSSDVSALSSVTLLGMDELECLLNDVRALDDDAVKNYEDVHVIVLHKEAGSGLGFTVAGGVDQNKLVTVHKILRNGVAAQEGSIHVGDQVLSINGTALHNSTHQEARNTMRKARGRTMAVVVVRRGDVTETCYNLKDSPQKAAGTPGSRMHMILNKSRSDLGFSLEGGVGSSLGDKPLTVQRLFQGGPVGKVFPGDELLEIEGQSLDGLRRLEVWQLIKRLPPGPVEVLLQRPRQ